MEGLRISHYRILRRLGSGGMGEVYAAEDERLRRDVAIKFISLGKAGDENARRRFEREAQAASALNHPNICTIFEVSEHEGQAYLVRELLDGQDKGADPVKGADDSVWPNLYLSIFAPTPTRSTLLSETSSTRTTLARPLINA